MRAVVFAVATLIGLNAIGTRAQEFRPLRIGPVAARVTGPTMDMPYELAKHPALQRPAGVSRAVALPLTSLTETWYLNALCSQIGKHFNDKSVGYQVVVVLPDGKWCGSAGGMARQSPDQDARAMTFEDKITIASVSKTITAAAMLHAMTEKKVSVDTKISPYLPDDWAQGPNINTITFRELFTHKSGFRCGDKYGGWALLFDGLRKCILDGVNLSDKVQLYRNENYALMRILLHQVLYVAPRVIAIPFAVKSG